MMWFGQTGLNVNRFETDLSASVNGLKICTLEWSTYRELSSSEAVEVTYLNMLKPESVWVTKACSDWWKNTHKCKQITFYLMQSKMYMTKSPLFPLHIAYCKLSTMVGRLCNEVKNFISFSTFICGSPGGKSNIHTVRMSTALSGSSALERFEHTNAIEIRNGIMFHFYPGLP